MSMRSGNRVLVLGGIRSGKSQLAESLLRRSGTAPGAIVRYVATGAGPGEDPEWAARVSTHRARRPEGWLTEEIGADPARLVRLVTEAGPEDLLLVDDLGGWLTATLDAGDPPGQGWNEPATALAAVDELAAAVAACRAARLVVVSPEVGMSLIPATPVGRTFADVHGVLNQRVAAACDAVALVVAGQTTWLVGPPVWLDTPRWLAEDPAPWQPATPTPTSAPAAGNGSNTARGPQEAHADPGTAFATTAFAEPTAELPLVTAAGAGVLNTGTATDATRASTAPADPTTAGGDDLDPTTAGENQPPILPVGIDIPEPDDTAANDANERLLTLRLDGTGLGGLTPVIRFAAGTQGRTDPQPWRDVRVLLLRGDHDGGAAAGDPPADADDRLHRIREGSGALSLLASAAGAAVAPVVCPPSAAMEEQDALDATTVDAAIAHGQRLADQAADSGVDLLVLAACGSGSDAAAVAVTALLTGGEPATLLARVVTADGTVHDDAWMSRCAAVRDALHRVRGRDRDPRGILLALGGGDLAVATGVLLGAAARRTPVLIDGPVGGAAALLAREYAAESRHWVLLPDTGDHPMLRLAADTLSLIPIMELKLGLGEGATALAVLPLLHAALTLSSSIPTVAPEPAVTPSPEPAGPDGTTDADSPAGAGV